MRTLAHRVGPVHRVSSGATPDMRLAGEETFGSEVLEFGVVVFNTGVFPYEGAPLGGMKQSGLGREGSHHALDDFLDLKYVCLGGIAER